MDTKVDVSGISAARELMIAGNFDGAAIAYRYARNFAALDAVYQRSEASISLAMLDVYGRLKAEADRCCAQAAEEIEEAEEQALKVGPGAGEETTAAHHQLESSRASSFGLHQRRVESGYRSRMMEEYRMLISLFDNIERMNADVSIIP